MVHFQCQLNDSMFYAMGAVLSSAYVFLIVFRFFIPSLFCVDRFLLLHFLGAGCMPQCRGRKACKTKIVH